MAAITAELVKTGEKRDTRGRRVMPAERRAHMVEAHRASGLTMARFARREKLKYASFAGWVANAQRWAATAGAIKFAEVRLPFRVEQARRRSTRSAIAGWNGAARLPRGRGRCIGARTSCGGNE